MISLISTLTVALLVQQGHGNKLNNTNTTIIDATAIVVTGVPANLLNTTKFVAFVNPYLYLEIYQDRKTVDEYGRTTYDVNIWQHPDLPPTPTNFSGPPVLNPQKGEIYIVNAVFDGKPKKIEIRVNTAKQENFPNYAASFRDQKLKYKGYINPQGSGNTTINSGGPSNHSSHNKTDTTSFYATAVEVTGVPVKLLNTTKFVALIHTEMYFEIYQDRKTVDEYGQTKYDANFWLNPDSPPNPSYFLGPPVLNPQIDQIYIVNTVFDGIPQQIQFRVDEVEKDNYLHYADTFRDQMLKYKGFTNSTIIDFGGPSNHSSPGIHPGGP